ncbi:MAG: hypothetical protein QGI68_13775 [Pseudomonadales bacterium]|jgi:hypothetical protein|nr:hypothetical protein [Pseudomonadales bacterium]MDP7357383.1 hypothetical protein [Pseudomonadales bacterium]MDP7596616.1 hypothetical protein [Pseudomonadales bacterium]HJN53414.1 hypothetical protein [Pseudomonadales bacterium]|tara:strand:- start:3315 stop:3881 length:567 start_codon:yes stop_codon:yes gene_type:complete
MLPKNKVETLRMLGFLKWLGIIIVVLALGISVFLFGMRFHDGPLEIVSGGPFKTGELAEAPDDWSFLTDRMEIEFQTMEPDTSRIVWLVVFEQRLYIISGYMNTGYGKIWKQWPHHLLTDDRIILRVDGKLYEQRLARLMAHPQLLQIMTINAKKYGGGADPDFKVEQLREALASGDFWLFEVVDRET